MGQLTHRQPQPDERLPIDHDSNVDVKCLDRATHGKP